VFAHACSALLILLLIIDTTLCCHLNAIHHSLQQLRLPPQQFQLTAPNVQMVPGFEVVKQQRSG
jgi:fumarate reductase subunit D